MSGRAVCAHCARPLVTCICGWVRPIHGKVEVLILQHPLEVGQAKGSARLLHLCLAGSRLVTGETFDEATLAALLFAPMDGRAASPLLLYPATPGACMATTAAAPAATRLVVLDATWRKSRKMLMANPLLQSLPRLALADLPPSRYRIRKAHAPHQLSTLEASAYALMQLDGEATPYGGLIAAFDDFVAQQMALAAGGAMV